MARNLLPTATDELFSSAQNMADACATHQAAIGIVQNTAGALRGVLTTGRGAESVYQAAKSIRIALVEAQAAADNDAKEFILASRDVLKRYLGTSWSQAWMETGFNNQSLALPANLAERLEMLKSLQLYFASHAAHENVPLKVTGARAQALYALLSAARNAVNAAFSDSGQKKAVRDEAVQAMRKRMRGLINELGQLLDDHDPRWRAFGLNMPGALETPDAPLEVGVSAGTAGHLIAQWQTTPRAERYHVYRQVVGRDTDFVLAQTVNDTDANLNSFTPGATVRVRVTAVNGSGESAPSTTIEKVAP